MTFKMEEKQSDLKSRWAKFRAENPQVKIREAAKELASSEAELLATAVGESVARLNEGFPELLKELSALGQVMALTRNDAIVHERTGEYKNVEVFDAHGKMGLVLGDDIDLRIFFKNWHFGFAVTTEKARGQLQSFQFFDSDGTAVHKIFLTDSSDTAAYESLVEKYRNIEQLPAINVLPKIETPPEKSDEEIDVENFRNAWKHMKDTHDFFGVTRKFGVSRQQALRLADREMAFPVAVESYQRILEQARLTNLPIMVFVGNSGIIQIHTGAVENLSDARGWFNVLDEKFNLHIKKDEIESAWIVRKPTLDGIVSSLELFDKNGENAALFFGKRKPGTAEMTEWRELLESI